MIKIIVNLILLYLLYKLIFDLIIPVVKTTGQVKKQMGEMNSRMQDNLRRQQQPPNQFNNKPTPEKKVNSDEYIDYEEVK